MIRACICDDKTEDLKHLAGYAGDFADCRPELNMTVDTFASPFELLDRIDADGGYDIYIFDILMPNMDGIELARRIRERDDRAKIIFLTISREYAIDAFGVRASGYLVKPVGREDLFKELEECVKAFSATSNGPAMLIKTKQGVNRVHILEIAMIESFDHSRVITMANGDSLVTAMTLAAMYEKLSALDCFFQPHRAYIINLGYVKGLTTTDLVMFDGRRVPISRKVYSAFREAYMDYTFKNHGK